MVKKATKKLLRRFKDAGGGKVVKGAKAVGKKKANKKSLTKKEAISLAKVLQRKGNARSAKRKKRSEPEPSGDGNDPGRKHRKLVGKTLDPESGLIKQANLDNTEQSDAKQMSLDQFLAGGFEELEEDKESRLELHEEDLQDEIDFEPHGETKFSDEIQEHQK